MKSSELGTEPITSLIVQQGVPAAIGILVMSIYMIVDTIFVGHFVGAMGIAAITVVLPLTFLIAAVGMAIGVGGGSMIARALGADNEARAQRVFGNQITFNLITALFFMILCVTFEAPLLELFGAQGAIMPYAKVYFDIIICGIPFLAWAMMSNHVIRAQGFPKVAMNVMLLPAFLNLALDPIFIYLLDWGLEGAAWATILSYIVSASYTLWFFVKGKSDLKIQKSTLCLNAPIVREMIALGFVSFSRQGVVSILAIVVNQALFVYGNEIYISVYGIINRVLMFALFPVIGLAQGFLPIASYNYGAQHFDRVRELIRKSIVYGTAIAVVIYALILIARVPLVQLFSLDKEILALTPTAMVIVFAATPFVLIQLVTPVYYQAVGKALPALLLTLTRQGFFLIPLVLILPRYWGVMGIWLAFPISDVTATLVTGVFLRRAYQQLDAAERAHKVVTLEKHLVE